MPNSTTLPKGPAPEGAVACDFVVLDRLLRRDHSGVRHFASLRHHGAISYAAWLAKGRFQSISKACS
jgi:hypothetical protein